MRRAFVLVFVLLLLPLASPAQGAVAPSTGYRIAIERFDLGSPQTVTVDPAATPIPILGGWIGPGSHLLMTMDSAPNTVFGCTANFLWTDGVKTYIGAAGHCFLPNPDTLGNGHQAVATHGPGADYDPSHTHVKVCINNCFFGGEVGFEVPGVMRDLGPVAYARQTASDGDIGNDFGLVEVPASLTRYLDPAMPVWGGPSKVVALQAGQGVCLYGNAAGLGETFVTKARAGLTDKVNAKSWGALIPAFEGDSGSALVTCGQTAGGAGFGGISAAGILTHLAPGSGGIAGTTIPRAEQMALEAGLHITPILSTKGALNGAADMRPSFAASSPEFL